MIMEKGKISALQMAILMNPTIGVTAVLLVPAITAKHAKQDLWLSPIWASLIGFLAVYVACRLNKQYPNQTIIEYTERILGPIPGRAIGLVYLLFNLHITGITLREYGEFIVGTFLHTTPMIVITGSMAAVCAFAVYGGIEVIGRVSEMVLPVILLIYFLIMFLLIPDLDAARLLPALENGLGPSFMGSVVPQGWFSEYILIAFLLPYVHDGNKAMKWGMASVATVMLILSITNVVVYMLFGKLTTKIIYPMMSASRYVSLAEFLEHIEALLMVNWVAGIFIKIAVFFYAVALGTGQWLRISDYRPIVAPVWFLLTVFSIWSAPNLPELSHFLGTVSPFYSLTVQIGMPILLLGIASIRNRAKKGA